MKARAVLGLALLAGGATAISLAAADEGASEAVPAGHVVTWKDVDGEAFYRLSGGVQYRQRSSCGYSEEMDEVRFSEVLPANVTRFELPPPSGDLLTARAGWAFRVEAVDSSGSILAVDSGGTISDTFCTKKRSLITWVGEAPTGERTLAITTLLAATASALGAGVIAWRKVR